jgi:hypothetical protein
MRNKILYLMFAAVALCTACSEDDEIYQSEVKECPVTGISVDNEFLDDGIITMMGVGTTTALQINVLPESAVDADGYALRFTTSDEDIFTVDKEGGIVAVASGEAELTVIVVNDANVAQLEMKYKVVVVNTTKVEEILVANGKDKMNLKIGETYDISENLTIFPEDAANKSVAYAVKSGAEFVSLNEEGVVTAIAYGTAVIEVTAKDDSGTFALFTIEVTDAPNTDVYLKCTIAKYSQLLANNILEFSGVEGSNDAMRITINEVPKAGEYSKEKIIVKLSNVTLNGKKIYLDEEDPGSFSMKSNGASKTWSVSGVLNLQVTSEGSVRTVGFEFAGPISNL